MVNQLELSFQRAGLGVCSERLFARQFPGSHYAIAWQIIAQNDHLAHCIPLPLPSVNKPLKGKAASHSLC